jgi:hypothetical protein
MSKSRPQIIHSVAKSQNAAVFSLKDGSSDNADRCVPKRATEVAGEFIAG